MKSAIYGFLSGLILYLIFKIIGIVPIKIFNNNLYNILFELIAVIFIGFIITLIYYFFLIKGQK